MKGIILAGGRATRLRPVTKIISKQLLLVYDKPMIFYPIETLVRAGIKDILIIVSPEFSGSFLNLIEDGKEFGARISFAVQTEPRGLADAFIVGEDFINSESVAMILGDNIFDHDFSSAVANFQKGGMVFAKEVADPERFGVVEFDKNGEAISIEEKPVQPKSNFALVGFYIFDGRVSEIARGVKPSARGEIEITEIQKYYLQEKTLKVEKISGMWEDAGTFDSLLRVSNEMAKRAQKT